MLVLYEANLWKKVKKTISKNKGKIAAGAGILGAAGALAGYYLHNKDNDLLAFTKDGTKPEDYDLDAGKDYNQVEKIAGVNNMSDEELKKLDQEAERSRKSLEYLKKMVNRQMTPEEKEASYWTVE